MMKMENGICGHDMGSFHDGADFFFKMDAILRDYWGFQFSHT